MALNRRWIKLGRLFMVAWLAFFLFPIGALLTEHFTLQEQIPAIGILLASGL